MGMQDHHPPDLDRSPPDAAARTAVIGSDPEALDCFYRAHVDDVIAYFARRCSSPHDVADLTAETFVAAIDAAVRYDPRRGRPIAWLIGIARLVWLRHLRSRATERRAMARISGRRLLDDSDIQRLEERIDAAQRAKRLAVGFAALTEREREVVDLVDGAGFTHAEAASALGISGGVLRIRLHRAHNRIKRMEQS